jgi:hypothetical protein
VSKEHIVSHRVSASSPFPRRAFPSKEGLKQAAHHLVSGTKSTGCTNLKRPVPSTSAPGGQLQGSTSATPDAPGAAQAKFFPRDIERAQDAHQAAGQDDEAVGVVQLARDFTVVQDEGSRVA